MLIFAENAWLGPERFAKRVLVEFGSQVNTVVEFHDATAPPVDAYPVKWLIPGMVNAHCHLEYSWLAGALPRGDLPFGEWMRAIVSRRPKSLEEHAAREAAMIAGARALIAGGCTAVIDSTTDGCSAGALTQLGLPFFLFYEVLGLSEERARPLWDQALARLSSTPPEDAHFLGAGINPHAPYSVGPWLRVQLKSPSATVWPQAWHLAETPDEEQLFREGRGSIADFLQDFGMPLPPRAPDSSTFLQEQHLLEHCGVIFHGNELRDASLAYYTSPRGIVHCPGTHRWFQRRSVPLTSWLTAGVNVCLGTDSLASSESLSMLEMLKSTLTDNPDLLVDDVLTMACRNPWKLNFLQQQTSSLRGAIVPGAPADLVAIAAPDSESGDAAHLSESDPWRDLLQNGSTVVTAVWIGGTPALSNAVMPCAYPA